MATVTVSEASAGDLDAIYALYRDLHDGDEPADPAALATAKQALSAYSGVSAFVAETHSDQVSSCVLFVLPNLSWSARPFGPIENVVTRRDCRNRGYATHLLDHALAFAWKAGCYKVLLCTGAKRSFGSQALSEGGDSAERQGGIRRLSSGNVALIGGLQ